MSTVKKNGKAYDSGDVVLTLLGNSPNEVREITYSTEQEHQLNYGLQNDAVSWSQGKVSHNASITMAMKEVVAIQDAAKAAGADSIRKIKPFDILVSYLNEFNKVVVDKVTCKFMSEGRNVDGEMGLEYQFDLFVLGIEYNIV